MTLVLFIIAISTADTKHQQQNFTIVNRSGLPAQTVARVSMPVGPGLVEAGANMQVAMNGDTLVAQSKVITKHPDGSVRRMILSFPVSIGPEETIHGSYSMLWGSSEELASMFEKPPLIKAGEYNLHVKEDRFQIQDKNGRVLCAIEAFGPESGDPVQMSGPEILDEGPYFVWLRWLARGSDWSRELDLQVDKIGHIRMIHRLQRRLAGNAWTPDFGFRVSATGASLENPPEAPVHFMDYDPHSSFAHHPRLVISLFLSDDTLISIANPLALRQNRGTLKAKSDGENVSIRSSRLEPVENIEQDGLMIQEGQWRVSELMISPEPADQLASFIDFPLTTHGDWRAYDAVYGTGKPLQFNHELLSLAVEKFIHAMQMMSINGDDWGNMTSWSPQQKETPINSQVRYNHCQYVWEDFFRTGDPRLFEIARDWSENYRNLTVYWGPQRKYYGGGRRGKAYRDKPGNPHGPGTYMVRFNYALGYVTKGFHNFWLAYEETGDPRFKEAAKAQASWSAENTHCHKGEMRNVGVITDFVKLYEYTGQKSYMDNAVRLWEEFKSKQNDDLLFTQHGKPAVGNDLYIPNDSFGYKHPFVKPYIVQYATNALPYLLKHRPDDNWLRDTILALNDWMARVQTPGGGYGYPAPSTAGVSWRLEYDHGLTLACEVRPKREYLNAVERDLRPIIQLLEIHGEIPSGINPWEPEVGKNELRKTYKLATDRDRIRDFTNGRIKFGQSPDSTAFFQVVLRDYLKYRDESSLLESDEILDQIKNLPTTLK